MVWCRIGGKQLSETMLNWRIDAVLGEDELKSRLYSLLSLTYEIFCVVMPLSAILWERRITMTDLKSAYFEMAHITQTTMLNTFQAVFVFLSNGQSTFFLVSTCPVKCGSNNLYQVTRYYIL